MTDRTMRLPSESGGGCLVVYLCGGVSTLAMAFGKVSG